VDMPFVTRELLEFLFVAANESEATVVVPRTPAGFQPLCAVYRRDFGAAAGGALRAGNYKIDQLFPSVTVRVIEEDELTRAGFSEQMFFNVNTADDLRTAQRGSSFPIGS
jgi:molybdopterin-guanine dinucleotide biosynthesis protein A